MAFRPRLARINNFCCDQVMPVALIPVCAISCSIPIPICQVPTTPPQPFPSSCQPYCPPPIYGPAIPGSDCVTPPYQIQAYPPPFPPPSGLIFSIDATVPVPDGYLICNGAAVSREEYQILFGAVGTSYGAGDGSTTFNLPYLLSECNPNIKYIIKT